jgi:acetolactate synthase-1/2/3 large subunit
VASAPAAAHAAVEQLQTGRPRPVEIEIPQDTLAERAEVEIIDPAVHTRPAASADEVQRAADLLAGASNPMIWAGGGVHLAGANAALQRVAEHLQAPVFATAEGRGALSDRHHLALGPIGFANDTYRARYQEHDLLLAVGTRNLSAADSARIGPHMFRLLEGQTVLQLDIDAEEIGRNHAATIPLLGDALATLEALYQALTVAMRGTRQPPRGAGSGVRRPLRPRRPAARAEWLFAGHPVGPA